MRTRVVLAGMLLLAGLGLAPPAAAEPQTVIGYPFASTATTLTGYAFDTCTAPSVTALTAWKASPYRGVVAYIGGRERSCAQPQLTAGWVSAVAAGGWRVVPVFLDRQASCTFRPNSLHISNASAASQGTAAARSAIADATRLGMRRGSAIYYDMEHYATGDASCRGGVLRFLSSWTKELHRQGYLAGTYVHQNSGARDLAAVFSSNFYARPDAVWIARWDASSALTGWPTVPDTRWTRHQRAKQYRGPHTETWRGVSIEVDSDRFDAPTATVALPYQVTSSIALNGRAGPSSRYAVARTYAAGSTVHILCQMVSQPVGPTAVWDRLLDGNWVTDRYLSTPSSTGYSAPLPACGYPFHTMATSGLVTRQGPGSGYPAVWRIDYGSLAWVRCQSVGTLVGTSRVWDRLDTGTWVADYYVADSSRWSWTPALPHCWRG